MIKNVTFGSMEYLVAENIGVPHGFTTRLGGVSSGIFGSLNLGLYRGDEPENVAKNREILAKAVGYDAEKLVMSHQTHSDIIRVVTAADAAGIDHYAYPESDALITNDPGTALWVFTADCTPILLHDPVTGAVGAVHAGWRGTANGIVAKAVGQWQPHLAVCPKISGQPLAPISALAVSRPMLMCRKQCWLPWAMRPNPRSVKTDRNSIWT